MRRIVVLSILLTTLLSGVITFNTKADHIYGGDIRYVYLKDSIIGNQTRYLYAVRLTMYFDCGPNSSFNPVNPSPQILPASTNIKIYEGALNASSLSSPIVLPLILTPTDTGKLSDALPAGCPTSNFCMYKIVYTNVVLLPETFKGYHFVYDVCCRTRSVKNIHDTRQTSPNIGKRMGNLYHSWMASTSLRNSSPQFADITQPSYCVGEVGDVPNFATDLDKNELAFSRYQPFDGEATSANPFPGDYTTWPPSRVDYKSPYTQNDPLGIGQTASVDALTGESKIKTNSPGDYVLGYQVKELDKNKFVIGLVRREFQFPILNCTNDTNKIPDLIKPNPTKLTVSPRRHANF